MDSDVGSSICANVVLVGAKLTALSRDTLELLLRRSVCVSNLHLLALALLTQVGAVVLADDILALVSGIEPACLVSEAECGRASFAFIPGKSNSATVAHAVTKDFARGNGISAENRVQLLMGR